MGEMKRAIAREQAVWSQNMQDEKRMKSTLVIAASIIAAVRLARDPDISRPSPRLTAVDPQKSEKVSGMKANAAAIAVRITGRDRCTSLPRQRDSYQVLIPGLS